MNIRILPTSVGGTPGNGLSGYVVDDVLALDAGSLGFSGTCDDQTRIGNVLLTHSHWDHIAGLPGFLENVYGFAAHAPTFHANASTFAALQKNVFNDELWPDFIAISKTMPPFLVVNEIEPNQTFSCGPYSVTALELDHTIPTLGYIVDDGRSAFALITDTSSVPRIIERLGRTPRLKAVFLESSFPRRHRALADTTKHFTTDDFLAAAARLPQVVVFAIHVKPRFTAEIVGELLAAKRSNVRIGEPGSETEI